MNMKLATFLKHCSKYIARVQQTGNCTCFCELKSFFWVLLSFYTTKVIFSEEGTETLHRLCNNPVCPKLNIFKQFKTTPMNKQLPPLKMNLVNLTLTLTDNF